MDNHTASGPFSFESRRWGASRSGRTVGPEADSCLARRPGRCSAVQVAVRGPVRVAQGCRSAWRPASALPSRRPAERAARPRPGAAVLGYPPAGPGLCGGGRPATQKISVISVLGRRPNFRWRSGGWSRRLARPATGPRSACESRAAAAAPRGDRPGEARRAGRAVRFSATRGSKVSMRVRVHARARGSASAGERDSEGWGGVGVGWQGRKGRGKGGRELGR